MAIGPIDDDEHRREQATQGHDDAARRVLAFQRKCAAEREKTRQELARLATKRAAVRAQLGVSTERMVQWRDEHQRMLQANALGGQATQLEQ